MALTPKKFPKQSLDFDFMGSWSYKQTLGSQTDAAKFSYEPMLTTSYYLNANNSIGIVLMKFDHFAFSDNPVYTFAYGFQIKHSWHKEWGDLGIFLPWMSYGLLLNWAVINDTAGAIIGHNTRIAIGTDLILSPAHHIVLSFAWQNVSYPSLGTTIFQGSGGLAFGLGYSFLF